MPEHLPVGKGCDPLADFGVPGKTVIHHHSSLSAGNALVFYGFKIACDDRVGHCFRSIESCNSFEMEMRHGIQLLRHRVATLSVFATVPCKSLPFAWLQ
jgi:hypothetical protein